MADIKIVKTKLRRGTDAQRKLVIFDQGEIVYTTDTKRVFVGSGVLSGGDVVGNKIHNPLTNTYSLTTTNAQVGDLVRAKNIYYQLTATDYTNINSWMNAGPVLSDGVLGYSPSNDLTINDDSLSAKHFDGNTLSDGIKKDSGLLKIDYDTDDFTITSNKITLKVDSVTEDEIASSSLGAGLEGGSGDQVYINYDTDHFYIKTGNILSLSSLPAGTVNFDSIDSAWIGDGLVYDGVGNVIEAVVTDVDTDSLALDGNGVVGMQSGLVSATNELAYVATDTYGRVIENVSSIYDTVSCLSATDGEGTALEFLFNGTPSQSVSGLIPDLPITTFTVLSSNSAGTVALTLSSAGFIMFEGGATARQDGKYIGRFAIPIFSY